MSQILSTKAYSAFEIDFATKFQGLQIKKSSLKNHLFFPKSSMGRGISLYEGADGIIYPTVPNKWKTLDEIDIPKDYMSRGRLPLVDEAFKIIKEEAPDLAIGAWVLGPFTLAGQIMELDILLKGLKKKKDQTATFLDEVTKVTIDLCKHYQELGVDFISVRKMGSGTDLLSPRMWKTLIGPNLKKVFDSMILLD